jgi:hypothetical protein
MGSSVSDSPATSPRTELAAIFAAAILRLNQRSALNFEDSKETPATSLEVSPKPSLNGHSG